LRTPLNAIIGFSEMLTAGIPGSLNSQSREYVENIEEGGGLRALGECGFLRGSDADLADQIGGDSHAVPFVSG